MSLLLRCGYNKLTIPLRFASKISTFALRKSRYSTINEEDSTILPKDEFIEQEESSRGKKIKPTKPNILVLDLKQSGLIPLRKNKYRNSQSPSHISYLEGIDFDDSGKQMRYKENEDEQLLENEALNLLKFSSKATNEQVVQSIDSLKPPTTKVSPRVFDDLIKKLVDRYTVKQLRYYIGKKNSSIPRSKAVKMTLASKLLKEVWGVEVSTTLTNVIYSTRTINLNDTQTKLLLLTQNGKILKNLSRLDKNLLIQLDLLNNQLRLWGNDSILKYIEISISKVLKNISVTTWLHNINEQSDLKIISKITRLCGVDINLEKNEIAAFGWKRIQLAKRLLLWSNYNDMENDLNSTSFKQTIDKIETETTKETWFPFTEIQNLNWLKRIEPLEYLHKVSPIEVSSSTISPQANILDILSSKDKADSMYDFFTTQSSTSTETTSSNVLSISLGQILKTKQPPVNTTTKKHKSISNWVFQSRVPQLSQKLMKLPLYNEINEEDELLSLDQHDYYLQLMFTPSSQSPNKETPTSAFSRNQPLELWLQLDENEQIVMDSVQAIIPTLRENYLIQTPDLPCDYKISNDHVINIPVTLESQPQLISYLNNIHTGNNIDNFKIPSELTMNNPSQNADSIKYDYVTCNRHKVLKLKYMDKYYVQYSEIDGGELGEKSQQIDFIANESNPTKEEFKQFVTDIFKF
ncbi:sigma-like sequence protein 1, mitochondrial [Monosporozyma unispora]|nr:hypothetical protein C6P44_001837 [Kazachstania unispora]